MKLVDVKPSTYIESSKKIIYQANQKVIEKEKVIKRKGDKLCVKWKGYDIFFNSWIDGKYKV